MDLPREALVHELLSSFKTIKLFAKKVDASKKQTIIK
jgi:hypothetical protein